jgi:hypothetical protein
MPFQDLQKYGYRPEGASAGAFLENVISTVEASGKFVDSYLAGQEKKQKKEKDKIDAYVSLRKAGYPEKEAYAAVEKWNVAELKGVSGAGDLETKKTQKEIEKLDADIAYKKQQTSNIGKNKPAGGGFDDPDDIPQEAGGLPLKAVKQDKKTGLWYGDYGKGAAGKESFDDIYDKLEDPTKTTRDAVTDKAKGGSWLSGIIGKFNKPKAGAAETKKVALSGKTKAGVSYTYKRK